MEAEKSLGEITILTTDEVLAEFLNAHSKAPKMKGTVTHIVREIMEDPRVTVVPQSRNTFLRGLERYQSRLDKDYSLTDCVSMNLMEDFEITEVLTHDHHFSQEGFKILM